MRHQSVLVAPLSAMSIICNVQSMFTNLFINCPRVGVIADGTATVALFVLDEPFVDALCVGVDRGSVVEIEQVLIVGEDLFVDGFHGAAVVSCSLVALYWP